MQQQRNTPLNMDWQKFNYFELIEYFDYLCRKIITLSNGKQTAISSSYFLGCRF